jgi:hypothetical protein
MRASTAPLRAAAALFVAVTLIVALGARAE